MSDSMKLVFCGTPQFAVPTLQALFDHGYQVQLVVTQPDRPQGRGLQLTASPVKQRAGTLGLPVVQPEKIKNNEEFRKQLTEVNPAAIIVVGYGRIIPQWMIDLPPLGNINLHGSLLPKYRGAAPIQWAIASGETVTGVTTMKIDAGLDTGDVLLQREIEVRPDDTSETIGPRLAELGGGLMVETLHALRSGTVAALPQDHSRATLAPILKKEDGLIDFHLTAKQIHDRLRGFQPWPGAFTRFRGKTLNIWQARPETLSLSEGELLVDGAMRVGCGENSALELLEVQPEGKKRMSAADFIRGYRPKTGERLGS